MEKLPFYSPQGNSLPQKGGWSRHFQNPVIIPIFVFLVLAIAGIVYWKGKKELAEKREVLSARISEKLESLKKDGILTTYKEMEKLYPALSPGENAAYVFQKAFDLCGLESEEYNLEYPEPDSLWPKESRMIISGCLQRNKKALEILRLGTKIEKARYPMDFREGYAMLLPHLTHIRDAARLLFFEATLAADDGQSEKAVESLETFLCLARSLQAEPMTISLLVRIAIWSDAVQAYEHILTKAKPGHVALDRLALYYERAEDLGSLDRALNMELCVALELFSKLREGNWEALKYLDVSQENAEKMANGMKVYKELGDLDEDCLYYLEMMHRMIQIARRPLEEQVQQMDMLDREIMKTGASDSKKSARERNKILSFILLPALWSVGGKTLEHIAKLRLARIATAIEKYRLDKGKLPHNLAELFSLYLPKTLNDPYTGKAMLFQKASNGYIIYSTGPNMKDDNGTTKEVARSLQRYEEYDITFKVMR